MSRRLGFILLATATGLAVWGCHRISDSTVDREPDTVVALVFHVELNPHVYEDSAWADPPQLAVWLENEADGRGHTVAVTHRTGAGDWEGKVECAVALPYWTAFYRKQTGAAGPPTWDEPAPDAITCATPHTNLEVATEVPAGTHWRCFVEVNVSGDYNAHFPQLTQDGLSDRYGNGQPSIVYRGTIEAVVGASDRPRLWGRTDQYVPVDNPVLDLQSITTARNLLRTITVSCGRKPKNTTN